MNAPGAEGDVADQRPDVGQDDARASLDDRLIAAHEACDWPALVELYMQAARSSDSAGDQDAACFYLTHAYVFALQIDDARADELHAELKARGREE